MQMTKKELRAGTQTHCSIVCGSLTHYSVSLQIIPDMFHMVGNTYFATVLDAC